MIKDTDILIIGADPTGCMAAYRLTDAGIKNLEKESADYFTIEKNYRYNIQAELSRMKRKLHYLEDITPAFFQNVSKSQKIKSQ